MKNKIVGLQDQLAEIENRLHSAKQIVDETSREVSINVEKATSYTLTRLSSALLKLEEYIESSEKKISSAKTITRGMAEDIKTGLELAIEDLSEARNSMQDRLKIAMNSW